LEPERRGTKIIEEDFQPGFAKEGKKALIIQHFA